VSFAASTFASVRQHRDIVLMDLRGTGRSHSLACPEIAALPASGVFDGEWLPPEAVTACRSRLERQADLRLYTTEIAMADLDEVRAALGYERINLYGTSYGTRAAQIYMRDFPERVRTATLKAVVPPSMTAPATHARRRPAIRRRAARASACRGRGQEPGWPKTPALLFSGDQDPVTPPSRAEEVAALLANGRHVVVANNGHGYGSLGECGQRLIAEFIDAGSPAHLDVSCATRIPAVPFLIERQH
jgi:pimeloyl-ACP methyl ester carboxylesterase